MCMCGAIEQRDITTGIVNKTVNDIDFFFFLSKLGPTLDFSSDGKQVGAVSKAGTVRLWNWPECTICSTTTINIAGILILQFSWNCKTVATASYEDERVRLWDASSGILLQSVTCPTTRNIAFSPNDEHLAIARPRIHIWDLDTGNIHNVYEDWIRDNVFSPFPVFSPDGKYLLMATRYSQEPSLWHSVTGMLCKRLRGSGQPIRSLALSPDGKQLASLDYDGIIWLWNVDIAATDMTNAIAEDSASISVLKLSPDGKLLAAGSEDGLIEIWDLEKHLKRTTFQGVHQPSRWLHGIFIG